MPFNTYNTNGMNKQGIGLGLFFCKKIIGKLSADDKLEIKSELGVGSIFSFKIYANLSKIQYGFSNKEVLYKS